MSHLFLFVRFISFFALLVTYNTNSADGSLDKNFGKGLGVIAHPPGIEAIAVIVQANGDLISMGLNEHLHTIIACYKPDGSFNLDFGYYATIDDATMRGIDMIVQPDGKILVGGINSHHEYILKRYLSNGKIDLEFGHNGIVIGPKGKLSALLLELNGTILACGSDLNNYHQIIRFTHNGKKLLPFSTQIHGEITRALIQPDKKIVVAGINTHGISQIVRYNVDGSLDTLFGKSGMLQEAKLIVSGLALQSDSKLIISGHTQQPSVFQIIRYLPHGARDITFGKDGLTNGSEGHAADIIIQADNKCVIVGSDSNNLRFIFQRLLPTGSLDETFGNNSVAENPMGFPRRAGVQTDGSIIAVGGYRNKSTFVLTRIISGPVYNATQIFLTEKKASAGLVKFSVTAHNPAHVYLVIDNKLIREIAPQPNTYNLTFSINGIKQGQHTAQAIALCNNQKLIIASAVVNFEI
jgi:uncharacterized delta-60 repeat protein